MSNEAWPALKVRTRSLFLLLTNRREICIPAYLWAYTRSRRVVSSHPLFPVFLDLLLFYSLSFSPGFPLFFVPSLRTFSGYICRKWLGIGVTEATDPSGTEIGRLKLFPPYSVYLFVNLVSRYLFETDKQRAEPSGDVS